MYREKKNNSAVVIIVVIAVIIWLILGSILVIMVLPKFSGLAKRQLVDRRLRLGNRYLSEMEYDKAVTEFNGVVKIDDKNTEAYVGLGDAYTGLGEWTPAVNNYDEAVITVVGVVPADGATQEEVQELLYQTETSEGSVTEASELESAEESSDYYVENVYDSAYVIEVIDRRDSALEMGLQEMLEEGSDAEEMRVWLEEVGHSDYTPEDPSLSEVIGIEVSDTPAQASPEDTIDPSAEEQQPEESEQEEAEPAAVLPDWNEAYRSFILNGEYWSSGQEYWENSYDDVTFAVYDLNKDAVPELVVFNNGPDMASMTNYIYTCTGDDQDTRISYLGNAGERGFGFVYAPDSPYPGLFTEGGNMGTYVGVYVSIENGELVNEHILTSIGDYSSSEPVYTDEQITADDALFQTFCDSFPDRYAEKGLVELLMYSQADIESMGWETFLSTYGY